MEKRHTPNGIANELSKLLLRLSTLGGLKLLACELWVGLGHDLAHGLQAVHDLCIVLIG